MARSSDVFTRKRAGIRVAVTLLAFALLGGAGGTAPGGTAPGGAASTGRPLTAVAASIYTIMATGGCKPGAPMG
jgi:hypothetical protein